jgi:hypothetical protein
MRQGPKREHRVKRYKVTGDHQGAKRRRWASVLTDGLGRDFTCHPDATLSLPQGLGPGRRLHMFIIKRRCEVSAVHRRIRFQLAILGRNPERAVGDDAPVFRMNGVDGRRLAVDLFRADAFAGHFRSFEHVVQRVDQFGTRYGHRCPVSIPFDIFAGRSLDHMAGHHFAVRARRHDGLAIRRFRGDHQRRHRLRAIVSPYWRSQHDKNCGAYSGTVHVEQHGHPPFTLNILVRSDRQCGLTLTLTGRRDAKRRGYPTAHLLGAPVQRVVGPPPSDHGSRML